MSRNDNTTAFASHIHRTADLLAPAARPRFIALDGAWGAAVAAVSNTPFDGQPIVVDMGALPFTPQPSAERAWWTEEERGVTAEGVAVSAGRVDDEGIAYSFTRWRIGDTDVQVTDAGEVVVAAGDEMLANVTKAQARQLARIFRDAGLLDALAGEG